MPSEIDHIALANKNHRTLIFLLGAHQDHPEWIATVAFYKAVHITEAVFANKYNSHSVDHPHRLDRVKSRLGKKYFSHFSVLYQKSKLARYLEDSHDKSKCHRFTDHFSVDQVVIELVGKRLCVIEQLSLVDLSDAAKSELQQTHLRSLPVAV